MALWHWLVGGAAAYFLLKPSAASATQPSVSAGQQVATTTESLAIMNYIDKAMAYPPNGGSSVTTDATGYRVKAPTGEFITPGYATLAELYAAVQKQYPLSGYGNEFIAAPMIMSAPPMILRDRRRFRR